MPITLPVLIKKYWDMIKCGVIDRKSRILLVDDGSKDKTWELITDAVAGNVSVEGIQLSHNRGHQNALLAGLMTAKDYADAVVSMDADLQDDINVLDKFVEEFKGGKDVVYGVRNKRTTDSWFKRTTALGFYKCMGALGVETIYNHADYRLMSRRALDALENYREVNLFLRGVVPLIGFPSSIVYYDRAERAAGESKYPMRKMLNFAIDGITSFSVKPLRMIAALGVIVALLSVAGLIYALVSKCMGFAVSGWTALIASVWLLGGIQMLCLGVVGEYVGKIYSEAKGRPRYTIARNTLDEAKQQGSEADIKKSA